MDKKHKKNEKILRPKLDRPDREIDFNLQVKTKKKERKGKEEKRRRKREEEEEEKRRGDSVCNLLIFRAFLNETFFHKVRLTICVVWKCRQGYHTVNLAGTHHHIIHSHLERLPAPISANR